MSAKLYIGNLNFNIQESSLRELFSEFGEITELHIPMDKATGRPRGFAFITMSDAQAAQNAIEKLNGQSVEGRNLTVNEARPKEDRRDSFSRSKSFSERRY